ncbi:Plasmid replication initiation protein [uncultured Thiomicrorhabdus sp.]
MIYLTTHIDVCSILFKYINTENYYMNEVVKKHNSLINASYSLSLNEQRLILLGVLESETIQDDRRLVLHAKAFSERFKLDIDSAYLALREAEKTLFDRQFSYSIIDNGKTKHVKTRWVSKVVYTEGEALIELIFAEDIIPLIRDLKANFSYYALEQVANLTSGYAIRLYELLISWRKTLKMPEIKVDELRLKLGVGESKYPKIAELKRNVIDTAIKQINEHTDITVKYQQHKRGRSISGFTFSFKFKTKTIERDPNTVDFISGQTDKESKKQRKTITKMQASEMARIGEEWSDLYKRLSSDYIIVDGKKGKKN